jgi:hypothetical protein
MIMERQSRAALFTLNEHRIFSSGEFHTHAAKRQAAQEDWIADTSHCLVCDGLS